MEPEKNITEDELDRESMPTYNDTVIGTGSQMETPDEYVPLDSQPEVSSEMNLNGSQTEESLDNSMGSQTEMESLREPEPEPELNGNETQDPFSDSFKEPNEEVQEDIIESIKEEEQNKEEDKIQHLPEPRQIERANIILKEAGNFRKKLSTLKKRLPSMDDHTKDEIRNGVIREFIRVLKISKPQSTRKKFGRRINNLRNVFHNSLNTLNGTSKKRSKRRTKKQNIESPPLEISEEPQA
jgi:hypothetical protein